MGRYQFTVVCGLIGLDNCFDHHLDKSSYIAYYQINNGSLRAWEGLR